MSDTSPPLAAVLPGQAPGRLAQAITLPSFGAQRDTTIVRRQGLVTAVNLGAFAGTVGTYPITVDVQLGGSDVTIPGLRFLHSYVPYVNDTVWIDIKGNDPMVIGSVNSSHFWYTATLQNGWSNWGAPYTLLKYCREPMNVVRLQGVIKGGTITAACTTVPVGFRPYWTHSIPAVEGAGGFGRVDVNQDGTVCPMIGSNASYSLQCIWSLDAP